MRVIKLGLATLAMAIAMLVSGNDTRASDGPLLAALDRLKCVPVRISQLDSRREVTVYEVTCKRSEHKLYLGCTSAGCDELSGRTNDEK